MNQFNRIFRILWSKTKGKWVVTSELEGPGGKKQGKGLVSVFCAALVAAGMLSAAPQDAEALVGTGTLAPICTGTAAVVPAGAYNATCTAGATDTLTNNGTISALSSRVITVAPSSTGVTINNNGVIAAGSSPAVFLARSTPFGVIGVPAAGTNITNTGTIQANNTSGNARVIDGSSLTNNYTGTIDNSGTISAIGSASAATTSGVKAGAIMMFNRRFAGNLVNTGTISAAATLNVGTQSSASLSARANTVRFRNTLGGTLSNSGTLSASVINHGSVSGSSSSTATVWAQVLDMGAASNPQVTNTGTITAAATNTGAISGGMDFKIHAVAAQGLTSNSNKVSAIANNSGPMTLGGMIFNVIGVDANTTLTNTAAGVISAQVTNTASIGSVKQVYGSSSSSFAFIAGVYSRSFNGVLTNAGSITASVNVPGHVVSATGLSLGRMTGGGTLDNSGTISGTSNSGGANGYSVKVSAPTSGTNSGAINNLAGGLLSGNISVAGGITVTNSGTIDLPEGANNASIVGSYTQNAGGKLTVGVSSTTSYAKLSTGTANLIAGSVIDVYTTPGNTLADGDVLTGVLTSTSLTAGTLTVTDNSSAFDFTVAVNGNSVDLTAVAVGGTTPSTDPYAGGTSGSCVASGLSLSSGLLPMMATLLAGIGFMRKRKKD
jgi:hypothetical protein